MCYNNYENIWKCTQIPVVRWKNILLLHVTFIVTHLMVAAPFLKAQASMPTYYCAFSVNIVCIVSTIGMSGLLYILY